MPFLAEFCRMKASEESAVVSRHAGVRLPRFMSLPARLPKAIYGVVCDRIMARRGLQPRGTYVFSTSGSRWDAKSLAHPIALPNLSGNCHPVLRSFWELYGLGDECLLVSENNRVKEVMTALYPKTAFITTDYFTELQPGRTDVVWDVCFDPPAALLPGTFSAAIANALMEHTIDPTCAFASLATLLRPRGRIFAMTHTPSFHLHRYPRDYVRFHHDYFEDLPNYLRLRHGLRVELKELWSRRGVVAVCYEKGA